MNQFAIHENWDNLSPKTNFRVLKSIPSTGLCAKMCAEYRECVQFGYESRTCTLSGIVIGGIEGKGIDSGWLLDRIPPLIERQGACEKVELMP